MHPVHRIAGLIGADTGNSCRVFEEPVGHADFADRAARGDVVSGQWHDLGVDEHEVGFGGGLPAAVKTERVARLEHERADLVVAALVELDLVGKRLPPAATQHRQLEAAAMELDLGWAVNEGMPREEVFDQDPGDRYPPPVLNGDDNRHLLAHVERKPVAATLAGEVLRPCLRYQPAGQDGSQQGVHRVSHEAQVKHQGRDQEDQGRKEPFHEDCRSTQVAGGRPEAPGCGERLRGRPRDG